MAMISAPDILAPYLVYYKTKPNAMESMQIYQKCLNDIQMDFTERLTHLRGKYEEVSRNENVKFSKQLNSLVLF